MASGVDLEKLVLQFNDHLNQGNVDAMMALMTEDCVFENTYPAPDGSRYAGQAAVRAFWDEFVRTSVDACITIEEIFACGDRCTMRWIYTWGGEQPGHVRGVDVYRIAQGKIQEKLSYVKG